MKYQAKDYAKAFLAAVEGKSGEEHRLMMKRFLNAVKKFGDEKNLSKILAALELAVTKERGGREVIMESAREILASLRTALVAGFKPNDLIRERTNPALIAGIRILINGEWMVDASLKRRLEKLFT